MSQSPYVVYIWFEESRESLAELVRSIVNEARDAANPAVMFTAGFLDLVQRLIAEKESAPVAILVPKSYQSLYDHFNLSRIDAEVIYEAFLHSIAVIDNEDMVDAYAEEPCVECISRDRLRETLGLFLANTRTRGLDRSLVELGTGEVPASTSASIDPWAVGLGSVDWSDEKLQLDAESSDEEDNSPRRPDIPAAATASGSDVAVAEAVLSDEPPAMPTLQLRQAAQVRLSRSDDQLSRLAPVEYSETYRRRSQNLVSEIAQEVGRVIGEEVVSNIRQDLRTQIENLRQELQATTQAPFKGEATDDNHPQQPRRDVREMSNHGHQYVSVAEAQEILGEIPRDIYTNPERLDMLLAVMAEIREYFVEYPKVRRWLTTPKRALGGRVPIDLIENDEGQQLLDGFWRLAHGVF